MTLSPLSGSAAISGATPISAAVAPSPGAGVVDSAAVGGGAAGAYMAQGGGDPGAAPGGGAKSLLVKMLAGGVVGAGIGFGASFITPIVNLIPQAKILLPAAGAAIGALGGLALHFIGKRKANLAMQAQAQATQQPAMAPTTVTPSSTGPTLRVGSSGAGTKSLQTQLKALGLFPQTVTGSYDKATANAVRRYEVLKGVVPTGLGTPDVRMAIKQDAALVKQYV